MTGSRTIRARENASDRKTIDKVLTYKGTAIGILLAVLSLTALPSNAENRLTGADTRCIIVGMRLAEMTDSSSRSQGVFLTLYYMGRLEGRTPQLNIETLLNRETRKMTAIQYTSEVKRCVAELADEGLKLTRIGTDLTEQKPEIPARPKTSGN